jgi:hypothetical protein
MHSSRELRSSSFEITVAGRAVRLVELFEGFGEHDRLGVVIRGPCGGVGASALITATGLAELRGSDGGDRARADAIAARLGEVASEERVRIKGARKELVEDEVPVETYRRIGLDEALGLLAPKPAQATRRPAAATR